MAAFGVLVHAVPAVLGLALTVMNIVGVRRGLRLYPVRRQFPDDEQGLGRTRALSSPAELRRGADETAEAFAVRLTATLNAHFIHSAGSQFPRVSPWHNWLLWLLGVLWPSRFARLEFRKASYALERGFGLCSQAAQALAYLLTQAGIPVRVAVLDGHVVATAETSPGRWIVLDPDYGVALPMSLDAVRAGGAAAIERAYGPAYGPNAIARLAAAYAGSHELVPAGTPRERRRVRLEDLAFALKWLLPLLLIALGYYLWFRGGE
jgi:hypothetical protein